MTLLENIQKSVAVLFFLFVLTTIFYHELQSQQLPNEFQIGDYVEVTDSDSIIINFNCMGAIRGKACSDYYRKGKIDSININVSGSFTDYYMNDSVAFKASMINNQLSGKATFFYKNGKIKAEGNYKNNMKTGVWKYYYRNGQLKKVMNFVGNFAYIAEYYKQNGKQKVIHGNGKYKGVFYPISSCSPLAIKGKVKNGKMDGKWKLYNFLSMYYDDAENRRYITHSKSLIGYEIFDNGEFIKGVSNDGTTYTNSQKILLSGISPHLKLRMEENLLCTKGSNYFRMRYKGKSLYESFYKELLDSLNNHFRGSTLKDQWFLVGLHIDKDNGLAYVNVKSSNDDEKKEMFIRDVLLSMNEFTPPMLDKKKIDFDLMFTILIRKDNVFIPAGLF